MEEQGRPNLGEERKKKKKGRTGEIEPRKRKGRKKKGKGAAGTVCGSLMCV